ncbi:rho guanine nucleotide exchange factor 18-like isoform X6 [Lytechinus variegatus]|uniref:rho guanine nucleotide exchange factor 18-like isoform X6 n=1 Tax=Lytechinus variegatus TaxID=7654 RepID=UPI001BB15FF7|nr:rho guanine nucleotide exchange factor 18-like isoform X6 [Lytechinus variegatus]
MHRQNPPPRETLLHFAARFGLRDFAEHLLDHPASDVALKLPNKDGDLAVELARTSGLDSLADRMLDISKNVERQSLNEDCSQRSRRLEHVEGKACKIKRHYTLSTATITTKLDESNNAIEDDIQMLRDVVSYMEADDDDSPRMLSPRKLGKHTKFGQISPADQGLSESSCSEDEEDEDEEDYIRHREYRGTLEPVLEDSIQQLQSINHHVQHLRKENRVRLAEGARRESLSRFSTSCPLLTEDKPEVEGWKQKMPSHPGAVNNSDDDDEDDDLDDLGRGSSITSPLSPKTPPIQIQVNDISLDTGGGGGEGNMGGAVIIPTIPSHHVVIPLAPIATTPEDSSPEDMDGDGTGSILGDTVDKEKTRRYSWGPEPDDSLRAEGDDGGSLSAASRSKSMLNLDATGKESFAGKNDNRRSNQGSRRDSVTALKKQNDGYGLGGDESTLPEDSNVSSSRSSTKNTHITPVVRRQKKNNLSTEQRQHRSASMYDTRLSELFRLGGLEEEKEEEEEEEIEEDGDGENEEEEEEEEDDDEGHKGKDPAVSEAIGVKPQLDLVRPSLDPLRQINFFTIFDFEEGEDEDFSSENDESGSAGSLSAEHRRQARLSLTEFLADPRNFDGSSETQQSNAMDRSNSVLRKFSFLKVGGQRREKKKEKEKDKEKEKEEKKEKEKEKDRIKDSFKQHNFVNSSFSNSTKCNYCEKPLQNKPALQCQICYANVHTSCKDNVAPCARLTKHPKSLSRGTGNVMRDKLIKSSGGLGYSQSMREKTRPNSILNSTKPFQPMPFQSQGSSSDVRSPLGNAGTIEENEENDGGPGSPPKTGLGNNNISYSVESLDEVGASTETWEFMEDEDLVTQGPEPESWSVMAEKKTMKKMSSKEIKRQDVIFEFIKTEKHHLRTLKIMQKIFSYGMQNELHMDQGLIKKVFPMLDEIVDIASKFYDRLQKRQKEAEVIERIGDILVDQFDGENGDRMMMAYGCLCSQQNEAKAVYKDLTKTDKRFQAFIKKCSTNALCRRWTIPECILSVSSRLTKYQLLIEAIIKPTKAIKATDKIDTHDLTRALELVKAICHDVNMQVQERERWQRLMEIYNKTEARSTGTLKSGKKFKKSDLLANRKLRHEGELYWKNARAKLTEVHGVLLTDVLLLLTENNGKYTFASQDNKPPVIPLFKLMVRDVAIDPKSVYLISQNKAGPEMYEVMCTSEHARGEWKKRLLEAIEQCPADDPVDSGIDNNNEEEEKKKAEERALRMKKLLEMMHAKDKELNSIISEKMRLVGELKELIVKEDSLGSLKIPLISQQDTQIDQTRDIILAAMKEVDLLTRSVYSGGNVRVSRSASSVGEMVSSAGTASSLPRRAETFSGFDSAQNGNSNKKRLAVIPAEANTRSSSFPNLTGTASEQLASFSSPSEADEREQEEEPEDKRTPSDVISPLPSPGHRPIREASLPVGRNRGSDVNRRRAFTLTGGVELPSAILEKEKPDLPEGPISADAVEKICDNPSALEHVDAATQILEHLNSLLKITVNQDTAFQTLKTQLLEAQHKLEAFNSTPTISTTGPSPMEKMRDSPPIIRMDPAGQDTRGSVNRGLVNTINERVTEVAATEKAKANGEKPGRSSPLQSSGKTNHAGMRHSESSPRVNDHNLTRIAYGDMIPSNNHLYITQEGDKNKDMARKNSAPSPLLQDKMNAYNSSPKTSPRRTEEGDRTVTSSSVIRRNVPQHLLSTTNQINTAGQVRQKLPLKLSNSLASTNSAVVQQMLPKKLESLSATSSKPNKNTNAQPQPTSDSDVIFF